MGMDEIIKRAGGPAKLGRIVRRHHATVLGWKCVPSKHALTVARALNVPVEQILPPPAPAHQEEDQAA